MNKGATGQPLQQIVQQIDVFLSDKKELVIVNISHGRDTKYEGNGLNLINTGDGASLTDDQWNEVLDIFKPCTNRFRIGLLPEYVSQAQQALSVQSVGMHSHDPMNADDLSTIPLRLLIEESPCVLVVSRDHQPSDEYLKKGVLPAARYPMFDQYAESYDPRKVVQDQISKMEDHASKHRKEPFMLNWTVTPDAAHYLEGRILKDAENINSRLGPEVFTACVDKKAVINFINADAIDNTDLLAVALALNKAQSP